MGIENLIIQPPVQIQLNDSDVGRTFGEITFERVEADYILKRKQDSPHIFGLAKQGVLFEILIPLAEHSVANLAKGFDVQVEEGAVKFSDTTVQEHKLYFKASDDKAFTFNKVVNIDTSGPSYSWNSVTVIPCRFLIILGTAGTLCKLGGENLPAQFTYEPEYERPHSIEKTFGGRTRHRAPFTNLALRFSCEAMTLSELNTLKGLMTTDHDDLIFTGLHDESYKVWFDDLSSLQERGGLWTASGVLEVEGDYVAPE